MNKNKLFKQVKSEHGDWSDEQIWTQVSVMINSADVISGQGPNVSLTQNLLRTILVKAKEWMRNTLPTIFGKVVGFFDELLEQLPQWAKKGLSFVFKMAVRYFSPVAYGGDYIIE